VYSLVPYEKGYLFLRRLEKLPVASASIAFFARTSMAFAFQSIHTDGLSALPLTSTLADVVERAGVSGG